jgi:hypothetical protein
MSKLTKAQNKRFDEWYLEEMGKIHTKIDAFKYENTRAFLADELARQKKELEAKADLRVMNAVNRVYKQGVERRCYKCNEK